MQTRLIVLKLLVDIVHALQVNQRVKQVLAHVQDSMLPAVAVPDGNGPFTQWSVRIFPVVGLAFLILGLGAVPGVRQGLVGGCRVAGKVYDMEGAVEDRVAAQGWKNAVASIVKTQEAN